MFTTNMVIPLFILFVMILALFKNVNAYESFIKGAKEGLKYAIEILPYVLGMIVASSTLQNSGIMSGLSVLLQNLHFTLSPDIFALGIFRPISGMASLAVLTNIFENFGPDSFEGILASVMQGSTDTTLYIVTVYFGAIGIKKYKHALVGGLIVDVFSFICGYFVVKYLMY